MDRPVDTVTDEGTICGKCGVMITAGMWPFCPHPGASSSMIMKDGIPGGFTLENAGPHPITFQSYSEMHAHFKANGLELKEKFCPAPGTDKDPQGIPNPKGYVDAQTLENGRILLMRQQKSTDKEWDAVESGVMTNLQTGTITKRDAEAIASGDKRRQSRFARRTE